MRRGRTGERGKTGDHGQAGATGATGATGARGERAIPPWAVRRANLAYGGLALGLFLAVGLSQYQEGQRDEREAKVMSRFEAEAVATDKAFCTIAADNRATINSSLDAQRALEAAVRAAFELVVPPPDATPAQRDRTIEFRRQILSQLNGVKIPDNRKVPDCSGIGNGQVDFSLQDAVSNGVTTTTRSTP